MTTQNMQQQQAAATLLVVRSTFKFLERAQITGAEAEEMLNCRQWLVSIERAVTQPPVPPPAEVPPVVAEANGK